MTKEIGSVLDFTFKLVDYDFDSDDSIKDDEVLLASEHVFNVSTSIISVSEQELTKKGDVRKRKKYEKTLQERKEEKISKERKKHYLRPRCAKCSRKCNNFSNDHRDLVNSQYWSMNWKERRIYISSNVSMYNVKRRRGSENSSRNKTFKYYFKNEDGEKLEVCKSFFLTTLGYNPKNDRVITNVMSTTADSIIPSTKGRGKHSKTPKTDRDLIKNHVESFSPTVSHYRREHAPNKKYLPSDLTIRSMHADFISANPNVKCSYELYRKCVSKDFNISFTKLGHEECEMCETFNLHNADHTKTSLSEDCNYCILWKEHIKKAAESRANYKIDAEKNFPENTVCVSADLEKVIMLPRLDMFKRVIFCQRIIVFNESFVPVGKTQKLHPVACLWHECISGRKKEDLISTFHAFIIHMRDKERIIIWLDNCASQNKNWSLFSYLIFIINSSEISAQTITFKYFEPGHTFMSADSFHHQVEQSLRKMKKVYDFADFLQCVQSSNRGRVTVKEMKLEDFFVWPDNSSIYKINHITPRPYLKNMVEITAKRGSYELFYKSSFSTDEAFTLNFIKIKCLASLQHPPTISHFRGISEERKQLILKNLLPLILENRRQFWEKLPTNNNAVDLRGEYDD